MSWKQERILNSLRIARSFVLGAVLTAAGCSVAIVLIGEAFLAWTIAVRPFVSDEVVVTAVGAVAAAILIRSLVRFLNRLDDPRRDKRPPVAP
jgi:hypothetical protein